MTFSESIKEAFAKKKREGGEPYFNHLTRVKDAAISSVHQLKKVSEENFKEFTSAISDDLDIVLIVVEAVSLGHDYIEDIGTVSDLFHLVTDSELQELGAEKVSIIMSAIKMLSRNENENYFDFINRIANSKNMLAKLVKLADLNDNMSDSKEGSRKDKYRFAYEKISANFWK